MEKEQFKELITELKTISDNLDGIYDRLTDLDEFTDRLDKKLTKIGQAILSLKR